MKIEKIMNHEKHENGKSRIMEREKSWKWENNGNGKTMEMKNHVYGELVFDV